MNATLQPNAVGPGGGGGGAANYTLTGPQSLGYSNQAGASGPWPHTRYISNGASEWNIDLAAVQAPAGARLRIADTANVLDDDLVGGVTRGGDFCLDLVTSGTLEVWAAPLTGGRIAVSLFNRSPGNDSITAQWADVGAQVGRSYAVRDIWNAADRGAFTGSYTAAVGSKDVAFLVLTPE